MVLIVLNITSTTGRLNSHVTGITVRNVTRNLVTDET